MVSTLTEMMIWIKNKNALNWDDPNINNSLIWLWDSTREKVARKKQLHYKYVILAVNCCNGSSYLPRCLFKVLFVKGCDTTEKNFKFVWLLGLSLYLTLKAFCIFSCLCLLSGIYLHFNFNPFYITCLIFDPQDSTFYFFKSAVSVM
jgi:hypothetical protein